VAWRRARTSSPLMPFVGFPSRDSALRLARATTSGRDTKDDEGRDDVLSAVVAVPGKNVVSNKATSRATETNSASLAFSRADRTIQAPSCSSLLEMEWRVDVTLNLGTAEASFQRSKVEPNERWQFLNLLRRFDSKCLGSNSKSCGRVGITGKLPVAPRNSALRRSLPMKTGE
jgi:hypothetical protein